MNFLKYAESNIRWWFDFIGEELMFPGTVICSGPCGKVWILWAD